MINASLARLGRFCVAGLLLSLAAGCSALRSTATPQASFYSLDNARLEARPAALRATAAPTLIVNPSHAAAGFDNRHIIYVRGNHQLQYFANSEWVDTPARMLAPLIVAALENSAAFGAVVLTPSAAAGDLRLDSEIIRLQHDFSQQPSRVRFTLRAYLTDNNTRQVLAWREFDETAAALSEDPYGGVVAANSAVQSALEKLSVFCAETARSAPRVK